MLKYGPARPSTRPLRAACAAIAALVVSVGAAGADPDPTGEWLVSKGYARIRVVNCQDQLWGIVAWEQKAGIDRNNPDPGKRSRPTLGMPVLQAMKPTEPNRWEGEIYNSEDGRTYSSNISLASPDVLQVRGCVLGFLCGGEDWTRVKPDEHPPAGLRPPQPRANTPAAPGQKQAAAKPANPRSPGIKPPQTAADIAALSADDVCVRLLGIPGSAHERGLK